VGNVLGWRGFLHNAERLRAARTDAQEQISELKGQAGKEILVFSSHRMWNDLLTAGLVDELHLMIGPAVLGAGTPTLEVASPVPLRLIEARTLENSALVPGTTRGRPRRRPACGSCC